MSNMEIGSIRALVELNVGDQYPVLSGNTIYNFKLVKPINLFWAHACVVHRTVDIPTPSALPTEWALKINPLDLELQNVPSKVSGEVDITSSPFTNVTVSKNINPCLSKDKPKFDFDGLSCHGFNINYFACNLPEPLTDAGDFWIFVNVGFKHL